MEERAEDNISHSLSSSLFLKGNSSCNNPVGADVLIGAHVFSAQGTRFRHVSLEITSSPKGTILAIDISDTMEGGWENNIKKKEGLAMPSRDPS